MGPLVLLLHCPELTGFCSHHTECPWGVRQVGGLCTSARLPVCSGTDRAKVILNAYSHPVQSETPRMTPGRIFLCILIKIYPKNKKDSVLQAEAVLDLGILCCLSSLKGRKAGSGLCSQ